MKNAYCLLALLFSDFPDVFAHPHSINPQQARAFLTRPKRSGDCTNEPWCEQNVLYCTQNFEEGREEYCPMRATPCPSSTICYLSQPCYNPHHPIETDCTGDKCMSYPCENGATCSVVNGNHHCQCVPGYDPATDCTTDFDECVSNPCLNGGTCNNLFNQFSCSCGNRFEGITCEKDCRPGPADIVFVVDTSSSMEGGVNKSINFIKDFVSKIPIGPDDFQVGVLTYNYDPSVLFDLNDYSSSSGILSAIQNIQGQDAATYTKPALQTAVQMLRSNTFGARSGVYSYIILLSDGLSSDQNDAVVEATSIKALNGRVIAVGLGQSVSHAEMLLIGSEKYYTFSPVYIEDLQNRLFREMIHQDCTDCYLHNDTDILLLLDTNSDQTGENYQHRQKVIRKTIESILSYNPAANIGIMSYSDEPDDVYPLSLSNEKDALIKSAFQETMDSQISISNTSHALQHIRQSNLFTSSRKFIAIISDGKWIDIEHIKVEIGYLNQNKIEVIGIIAGEDTAFESFESVIRDPSLIFYTDDDNFSALDSLASMTTFYKCTANIFSVRQ